MGGKVVVKGVVKSIDVPKVKTDVVVSKTPQELNYNARSGVKLIANPDKITTILGRYDTDSSKIIDELNYFKTLDFEAKQGGFNVLNTPDNLFKSPEQFWNDYNKSFLDKAIERGNDIVLMTKPEAKVLRDVDSGKITGFGREIKYLEAKGYTYDLQSNIMVKR
ncbi:hypothetical protein [Sulfurimonas sp. CS5]|uniref:hypothetical protein n=1 Tax=Sulfurimonas sp. CS5 TaxID=3391145 RepID=UPI0039EC7247